MSVTHTHGNSVSDGSRTLSGSQIEVGTVQSDIDVSLPASTTNQSVALAFTTAGVQSLFFIASSNLTIKTNSTSSPGNTINLLAGNPLEWRRSGYYADLFTVDVTVIYVTCTSACRLQAKVLV